MKTAFVAAVLVVLLSVVHAAEAPISEVEARDRMQKIAEEIQVQRRLLRQMRGEGLSSSEELAKRADSAGRDVECSPIRWVTGSDKPVSIALSDLPLWHAAQFYAFLTQKEVVVSSSVAPARFSLTVEGISRGDAISRFDVEFARMGVVVQPVGDSRLNLVARTEPNSRVEPRRPQSARITHVRSEHRSMEGTCDEMLPELMKSAHGGAEQVGADHQYPLSVRNYGRPRNSVPATAVSRSPRRV